MEFDPNQDEELMESYPDDDNEENEVQEQSDSTNSIIQEEKAIKKKTPRPPKKKKSNKTKIKKLVTAKKKTVGIIIILAIMIPFLITLLLDVLTQETVKNVTDSVTDYIEDNEGIDPIAKDLYKTKFSLLLMKVSEINGMYDFFMNSDTNKEEVKSGMSPIIGFNDVEGKKANSEGNSDSAITNQHEISCSATAELSEDQLIRVSRLIQAMVGLDKKHEEYIPLAAVIANRMKLRIADIEKTDYLPGIIDNSVDFPALESNNFLKADSSTTCVAYKAVLNAFNGEDPTSGATLFYLKGKDKKPASFNETYNSKKVSSNTDQYYIYGKKRAQKDPYTGAYNDFKCNATTNFQPYLQQDPRWENAKCVDGTMASQGCGPTSVAVILTEMNLTIPGYDGVTVEVPSTGGTYKTKKDGLMEPVEVAKIAADKGGFFVSVGLKHSFFTYIFSELLGLREVVTYDANEALKYLQEGYIGVASCQTPSLFTDSGHIIAVVGARDSKIQIHNVNGRSSGFYTPASLAVGAAGNISVYYLYKK